MKKIKFIGYDVIDGMGEMITMNVAEGTATCIGNDHEFLVNIEDLMQFTGLYDKNGKEVYEGYILQSFDYKNEPEEIFVIENKMFYNCGCCSTIYGYNVEEVTEKCEIIGNIHENKELINKGK